MKTILGGLVAVLGYLSQPEVLNVLPGKGAAIVTAAGALFSIIGARHAIHKASKR